MKFTEAVTLERLADFISVEKFVCSVYESVSEDEAQLRFFYLFGGSLMGFEPRQTYAAMSLFSHFDESSDSVKVSKAAKVFNRRYRQFLCYPQFVSALKRDGLAGFRSGSLFFVAHVCVKPGEKKYQMTTFAEGIGPLGDCVRESPWDFVAAGATGAGIPLDAVFLNSQELLALDYLLVA